MNHIFRIEHRETGRGPFRHREEYPGKQCIRDEVGDRHEPIDFTMSGIGYGLLMDRDDWVCAIRGAVNFSSLFQLRHITFLFAAGFVVKVYETNHEFYQADDSWCQCIVHNMTHATKILRNIKEYCDFMGIDHNEIYDAYEENVQWVKQQRAREAQNRIDMWEKDRALRESAQQVIKKILDTASTVIRDFDFEEPTVTVHIMGSDKKKILRTTPEPITIDFSDGEKSNDDSVPW